MKRIDTILGSIFALFNLIFLVFVIPRETFSLGDDFGGLSPAFFPYFVSGASFGLSALLALKNFFGHIGDDSYRMFERGAFRKFILSCLLAFGSIIGLCCFGFLFVAPLTVAAAMFLMGCRKWIQLTAVSLLSSLILYWVFAVMLNLALPKGLLFL